MKNKDLSLKRKKAQRQGHLAEIYAGLFLQAKGYRLLCRRFQTPSGEIDLVAIKKNVLVFIEVKSRSTLAEAISAVTPQTQKRIAQAGKLFMHRFPQFAIMGLRYDIIAISGLLINHQRDAWRDQY